MKHASIVCLFVGHRVERTRESGYWRISCTRCGHEWPIQIEDDAMRAYGTARDVPREARR